MHSHLCHLQHTYIIVHMVLEGAGFYFKPATAERVTGRFWEVVFTFALQGIERHSIPTSLYYLHALKCIHINTYGRIHPKSYSYPIIYKTWHCVHWGVSECACTFFPSIVLVSMTTISILLSQIICQKSSTVPGTGAVQIINRTSYIYIHIILNCVMK